MLGAFLVKGSEPEDSDNVVRDASGTRPLGLKNTVCKILTSVVTQPLTRALPGFINQVQRGFVPKRNFGDNIIELDTEARITSMMP
eukprot:337626-Pyramimonas_sp.AAC.1